MKKNNPVSVFILILTAFIWGCAFVAQSEGGDAMGPLTFAWARSFITSVALALLVLILNKTGHGGKRPETAQERKTLIKNGIPCGICLYLITVCQQLGMYAGTPVGKAGFLTACYVVLVPVLGLFFRKNCGRRVWFAVCLTIIGLYLLCITDGFSLQGSDLLVFGAAIACAFQIIIVDRCIDDVNPVYLSLVQFITGAVIGIFPALIFELIPSGIKPWAQSIISTEGLVPVLYAGIVSGAGGYTLQIIGQKGCEPAAASILMSLESVFSVLAGWILLGQVLSGRELFGCALIFAAVVLAQLPDKHMKNINNP